MGNDTFVSHQQWLNQSAVALENISNTAVLDARVLLSHCLKQPLSYFLAWPERLIAEDVLVELDELLERRVSGEPIAYIIGLREFWSMNFYITPDVLIPRPETEHLVEWALSSINDSKNH